MVECGVFVGVGLWVFVIYVWCGVICFYCGRCEFLVVFFCDVWIFEWFQFVVFSGGLFVVSWG